jgi:putative PIN family toxin of toxin-antitoxin system
MGPKVIIDTNVLIAALRSRRGASFRVLEMVGRENFEIALSVPLVLEYEEVAKRHARSIGLRHSEIDVILDYLCSVADRRGIFFLWRPVLKDSQDDMVLEVAVEAGCDFIVTHNVRDFDGAERFGIRVVTPSNFLRLLEGPK